MAFGLQKRRTRREGEMPKTFCYFDHCTYLAYFKVRIENNIPENAWAMKREEIAKEIRDLGVGYRQILRDGWIRYINDKYAASGKPIQRRVDAVSTQKRVVADEDE